MSEGGSGAGTKVIVALVVVALFIIVNVILYFTTGIVIVPRR